MLRRQGQYLTIGAGQTGAATELFLLALAPLAVGGRAVPLTLDIQATATAIGGLVDLAVSGPAAVLATATPGGAAAPGSTTTLGVGIRNAGDRDGGPVPDPAQPRPLGHGHRRRQPLLPAAAAGATGPARTPGGLHPRHRPGLPGRPPSRAATLDLDFAEGNTAPRRAAHLRAPTATDPSGPDAHGLPRLRRPRHQPRAGAHLRLDRDRPRARRLRHRPGA